MKIAKEVLNQEAQTLAELVVQINELQVKVDYLKEIKFRHRILPSSIEDCDDDYQEQLEITWELKDRVSELANKKLRAETIINWFTNNGYPNALIEWMKQFHPECVEYISAHNKHN